MSGRAGQAGSSVRVALATSGLGHVRRGYERATEALADALAEAGGCAPLLVRGGGAWTSAPGLRLPCLRRGGRLARALDVPADVAYGREQHSFALGLYPLVRAARIEVVHLHDPQVMNALWHARRLLGGDFAIVFSNGGALSPEHLRRPDLVHCLTPLAADALRAAGFEEERIATIPYGIALPSDVARSDAPGPLRAIGVGALEPDKGVEVALRALAELPGATLEWLGQPTPHAAALRTLAAEWLPGRATLRTVEAAEVQGRLLAAHVFVLPTRTEGFGLAVLEALAAGLPCVLGDLPVLRWLARDAALYVRPDDVDGLRAALAQLTPVRRAELGARARARAAELSWAGLVPQYRALYARAREVRRRA